MVEAKKCILCGKVPAVHYQPGFAWVIKHHCTKMTHSFVYSEAYHLSYSDAVESWNALMEGRRHEE